MADSDKKQATRVFKKSSRNGWFTTYIGKRDFIADSNKKEPIIVEGVALLEPDFPENTPVHASLVAIFRYGREELDVLGIVLKKELYTETVHVYPADINVQTTCSKLQSRLSRKLGNRAYPFSFQIPIHAPSSVTLQPVQGESGKPCGVDYELKVYVPDEPHEKAPRGSSVSLAIRKLTYVQCDYNIVQPIMEIKKEFLLSHYPLVLEASLDKPVYWHGEEIKVNVHISNQSNRIVKKMKISVHQVTEICLFSQSKYTCKVASLQTEEGFPVQPTCNINRVYSLVPSLETNRGKRGLALDGQLKHEDTNMASSTLLFEESTKENAGIIVSYNVRVRLVVSLGGDVTLHLPIILTHPPSPPEETFPDNAPTSPEPAAATPPDIHPVSNAVDVDLITFDMNGPATSHDDELVFEDFTRRRLQETASQSWQQFG